MPNNSLRITPECEQVEVNVVGSSTYGRYGKISKARTTNLFISDNWLINFSGYKKAYQLPITGEGRGIFHSVRGNLLILVVRSVVFKITSGGAISQIGTLNTSRGEVFMDENLDSQICLVDGLNAYIYNYDIPGSFTVQSDIYLGSSLIPNYVRYHDTYFLIGNINQTNVGSAWYIYSFATDTTITYTKTLSLSTKPDYAIAIQPIPGQANNVLVFGTTVAEIQTNVNAPIIYRKNSTINIDFGCASVSTIAASDKYVIWLAVNESNSPVIMIYNVQNASGISTDGIDYLMGKIKYPAQSTAMFYRQDGHLFYQLTFFNPADNLTIAYDVDTKKFYDLVDKFWNFHPARKVVYFNLKDYFLSITDGQVYEISSDYTVIDENLAMPGYPGYDTNLVYEMYRERICDPIRKPDTSKFRINSLTLNIDQGNDPNVSQASIDLATSDYIITESPPEPDPWDDIVSETDIQIVAEVGSNVPILPGNIQPYVSPMSIVYRPRVDLSVSKDGGVTWSGIASRYLHPIGWRKNILTFNNLGQANDLTIKFQFWGTSNLVVNQALVDLF